VMVGCNVPTGFPRGSNFFDLAKYVEERLIRLSIGCWCVRKNHDPIRNTSV